MKLRLYLAALAGLALATGLVAYQGASVIYRALAVAGWGLVVVALVHLIPLTLDTLAWRVFVRSPVRPSFTYMLWARWIVESVNNLLPVAQIGGRLVGVRLLMSQGVSGAQSGASVTLELTLSVLTQFIFTGLGLGLLLLVRPDSAILYGVLIVLAVTAVGVVGFVLVQQQGFFGTLMRYSSRLAGQGRWLSLVGGAEQLDAAIKNLYRCRSALTICGSWQLMSWIIGSAEVWLALYFLGHPVTVAEAVLLESLGQAVRSAAFTIPGALGVQEGGYMLLGVALGLSPELGLTLSLVKRMRELLIGLPGLAAWQVVEGMSLVKTENRQQAS